MDHHQCTTIAYHLGRQALRDQLLHRQVYRPEPQKKNQRRRFQQLRCQNQLHGRMLESRSITLTPAMICEVLTLSESLLEAISVSLA